MAKTAIALILSGGGMKGLAHVGVLKALAERGIEPDLVVGSSIGALIAAVWASGTPIDEMVELARQVKRRHVFAVAHADMAFRRMRAPAVYRREPLDTLIEAMIGRPTFRQLKRRILVNTVDLQSGVQVLWGLPGLDDIPVADAVFASCALPGIFPPREIKGRQYVDGAVVENLPVGALLAAGHGAVIAVNLNPIGPISKMQRELDSSGFAATYIRGLELVMQVQSAGRLRSWQEGPLVLVQPRVAHISMFAFDKTDELIAEGWRATGEVLDELEAPIEALAPGIHPRRTVRLDVDRDRCVGCGACALLAPQVFALDGHRRAVVLQPVHYWSPVDGLYVGHCPTFAISVSPVEEKSARKSKA